MTNRDTNTHRDRSFDILKAIGIISMLIGHAPGLSHTAHQIIYSYHMPLFFLVAGYFIKDLGVSETLRKRIVKDSKRLLLPFVFTQVILILWTAIQFLFKDDPSMFFRASLSLLWGGEDGVIQTKWGMLYVDALWFLPALFVTRTLYALILYFTKNTTYRGWTIVSICLCFSICANVLHNYVKLPWAILQGVSALIFVSLGWLAKNRIASLPYKKYIYIILAAFWIPAILYSSIEMYACSYSNYPLAVLGACGGTIVLYYLSCLLSKMPKISSLIAWLGFNSLPILCFHAFERCSSIAYSINCRLPIHLESTAMVIFRYALTIFMAYLAIRLPILTNIYSQNKANCSIGRR